MTRSFANLLAVGLFVLASYAGQSLASQTFTPPPPGSIYKEFTRLTTETNAYRVTDPNATNEGSPGNSPAAFLPNDELDLNIDDLQGAVRAEVLIDHWGGHVGTTGKRFRFNGNSWIDIAELTTTAPADGECYNQQRNVVLDVPLSHLTQGTNIVQGDSGGQTCWNFNWGQWGWYTITVRVYYDASKAHPTGAITAPGAGVTFGENPTLSASASSSAGIDRVEFVAYYDGYDTDGDGVYADYQRSYHRGRRDNEMLIANHAGTATSAPYQVTWDTSLVPDQSPGAVKLMARIRDNNGVWFVTNEITNLTLQRNGESVRLYKPENVPEKYNVRARRTKSNTFNIPTSQDLSKAVSARILLPTWNGDDGAAEEGQEHHIKINNWEVPDKDYGANHFYSFDILDVPTSELKSGENTVELYSESDHHGIEIMWPGPGIIVRYSGSGSQPPPPTPVAPSITSQPQDQVVVEGNTAVFSVTANGDSPLSYQWQENGNPITGATNASYSTPATELADSGTTFQVVVSNSAGSVTSNSATLTVNAVPSVPPSITVQPGDQTVNEGQSATFTVTANGSAPLSYQWQKNGSDISGANSASYTTPQTTATDDGASYRVVVSNAVSSETSTAASLTVNLAPVITVPPADQAVVEGDSATFSVTAGGAAPLSYQWQRNTGSGFANISGATSDTYTTPATASSNDGTRYRVVVNNVVSSVNSASATLSVTAVAEAPTVTTSPTDQSVVEGDSATFNVTASGTAPFTYEWQRNTGSGFGSIAGATSASYTTPATTLANDGSTYRVVISNAVGNATSAAATLTVTTVPVNPLPPVIDVQPTDQAVSEGLATTFSVVASGTGPLSYQWRKDSVDIAGAGNASYTTPPTTAADNGAAFDVVVTNAQGTVTSNTVTLTVNSPDSNGDGLSDANALALGLDPNNQAQDTDGDGLSDVAETGGDAANPLPVDTDSDGVIDALEPGDAAGDASTASGLELPGSVSATLTSTSGEILSEVSTADASGGPAGVSFPFGTISYKTTSPVGGSVTVRMSFSTALPAGLDLYKVDNAGVYTLLPASVWTLVDSTTVELTLTDGDILTDLDGVANGEIVDPVAPADAGTITTTSSSSGGGGGGCTLSASVDRDPTLPLLMLLSLGYLVRREFSRAKSRA